MEKYYRSATDTHINCEKPRAYFIPFSTASIGERRREMSPAYISLNGKWDFAYIENTDAFLPLDDSCPKVSYTGKIPVPSNWQYFPELTPDVPQYINQDYPFPVDPPHLPDVIPSGFYHRTFRLTLNNRRYFINFEGVAPCFYLWINQQFVGFGSVSHCTNEFEITDYVQNGDNDIHVLCVKYCVGSYCEDQDFFRLNGIFRDVYILERENNCIRDIFVRRTVSEDLKTADVSVELKSDSGIAVNWVLNDYKFKKITSGSTDGSFEFTIENPDLWNPEEPYVYNLSIQAGNEFIDIPLSIRRFEIKNRTCLLNGVKFKCRGVNRHDMHPEKGYAVDYEHMRRDLLILKRANVNMIRTSHYPNDPRFLEMCDRMGFALVNEADLETHGMGYNFGDWYWDYWSHICDDELYKNMCVDRAIRLYERDKNYGCVLLWSLGNESGCGENHRAMAKYIRSRDPQNLIHYENAHLEYSKRVNRDFSDISDVESRMYAPIDYLREYLADEKQTKPFFYCEYVDSMSTGDVYKYWDEFNDIDGYFGGCIWEFADHAVNIGTEDAPLYRYGGDWGEYPNDGYSCIDGVVYPDRTSRPGYFDMKKVYEPYSCEYSKGYINVKNRKFYTDSKDIYIEWSVETDGKVVQKGTIDSPNIAPGNTRAYGLFEDKKFSGNTVLNISFCERTAKPWAKQGYEITFSQFILSEEKIDLHGEKKPIEAIESKTEIIVTAMNTRYVFDKIEGTLKSVMRNNMELLDRPLQWNIMRGTTYNTKDKMNDWLRARYDKIEQKTYSVDFDMNDEYAIVTMNIALSAAAMPPAVKGKVIYKICGDGVMTISFRGDVTHNAPPLPEFSCILYLNSDYESLRYYGYGPFESYKERHRAARLGYYKTNITDNLEKYIKPQESSAHFGTRLAVISGMYNTLAISATRPASFSFNALHYTWDMLYNTKHYDELKPLKTGVIKITYDLDSYAYSFDDKHIDFEFDIKI
jgi:beta-galactosidase